MFNDKILGFIIEIFFVATAVILLLSSSDLEHRLAYLMNIYSRPCLTTLMLKE